MIRFFRHYIPMSMFLLTVVEFLVFAYISGFAAERYGGAHMLMAGQAGSYKIWLFAAILTLLNSTFGLYDWEWTKGLMSLLIRVGGSFFVSAWILALGGQMLPQVFPVGAEYLIGILVAGLASVLIRYFVVPVRPAGTEGWSEEKLAALISTEAMQGLDLVKAA